MTNPRLTYTQHAETMLVERGISREWVERAIKEPEAVVPDATRPNIMRAFVRIPERGGRFLRVVYVAEDPNLRIITAFFDRDYGRGRE